MKIAAKTSGSAHGFLTSGACPKNAPFAPAMLRSRHESAEKQKKALESEPAPEPVVATTNTDEEIVAVITAAIAMAESESGGIKFRVVSFKRR